MENDSIIVEDLTKIFIIKKRKAGFLGSILGLFYTEKVPIVAVENISFKIQKGEIVGYVGPNGAGKSTTIKMLTGILMPSRGKILIQDKDPFNNRKEVTRKIGVVFGQRTQLWWDLPLIESYELLRLIYKIEKNEYQKRFEELVDLLGLKDFLHQSVRKLSLGQRMRADLAASLIHEPEILFLDEPTIGLDILTKDIVRKTIFELKKKKKITVILTTHDMEDIEYLAKRLILIDKGRIRYDGELEKFNEKYQKTKRVIINLENAIELPSNNGFQIIKNDFNQLYELEIPIEYSVSHLIKIIQNSGGRIMDINVKRKELADTLKEIYSNQKVEL